MSQIFANKLQAGISMTPANNFIIDASANNGTAVLKRADGTVILNIDASGNLIGKNTNPIDTTTDRLMQVGNFGLGSNGPPSYGNANDAILPGLYAGPGVGGTNYPGSNQYGVLLVQRRGASHIRQESTHGSSTTPVQSYVRYTDDLGATWTPWHKIFNQSTILGTVSQTAGIPTGAIIESGSNANGRYTKFADGTLICHINTSSGGSSKTFTFPTSFVDTDTAITTTFHSATSSTLTAKIGSINTGSVTLWFVAVTDSTYSSYLETVVTLKIMAIGRWF